ncbi:hypothetical protein KOI35_17415 [Actinoplanes bogorensis]|uniref:Uncharacterized protein n=1 Tax=Paractinoplanes bogorensis TaxID=1610840 RepID=A0ABS5YQD8_9ACTN|nr:hypothetical protein [Actinoplanes bogorensis]MBU2665286.1 hypothetical protein [Actinoplanes bogorensis]
MLVLFAVVAGLGWMWASSNRGTPMADTKPTTAVAEPGVAQGGDAAPELSSIKLTPKVIDRECFGDAGCNVTLRVDMELTAGVPAPSTTWLVVYEIHGIEDGPQIGSLELTGSSYTGDEESVSTTSSKAKVTVRAVSVERA